MAIDIVKNLNTKPQEINQRTAQSATAGAQKMALEKAGAQGGAAPTGRVNVAARLGEQQQEQAADNTVNQAAKANQQQFEQQGQMNVEQEFQERVLSDEELQTQNTYNIQMQSLFDNYERSRAGLDQDKADFDTQMLAQSMRLQNTQYIDELNAIAKRENFDNEIAFQNKAAEVARGRSLGMLRDRLNWERINKINEIDFNEELGIEDIETAMAVAMTNDEIATNRQNMQNIGNTIGAGAQAYSTFSGQPTEDEQNFENFKKQQMGYDPNVNYGGTNNGQ